MTKIVYKIINFVGSVDDIRDGFIYLSARHQLRATLEKHFKGEDDLILIAFEVETHGPSLKCEQSRGGDLFPHLYGYLPISQSLWHRPRTPDAEGVPRLDEALLAC
jgi:uncharacterized protein (DUF952 family)